jgi:hypothetical protein
MLLDSMLIYSLYQDWEGSERCLLVNYGPISDGLTMHEENSNIFLRIAGFLNFVHCPEF